MKLAMDKETIKLSNGTSVKITATEHNGHNPEWPLIGSSAYYIHKPERYKTWMMLVRLCITDDRWIVYGSHADKKYNTSHQMGRPKYLKDLNCGKIIRSFADVRDAVYEIAAELESPQVLAEKCVLSIHENLDGRTIDEWIKTVCPHHKKKPERKP